MEGGEYIYAKIPVGSSRIDQFKAGAVLVGAAAYLVGEPLVGSRLPSPMLMTADVDLALEDALGDQRPG